MELISKQTNFDFMGLRKYAAIFSIILTVGAIVSFATQGLNYGIDFTGGTLLEVSYSKPVELGDIRSSLKNSPFSNSIIQHIGSASDVLIRIAPRVDQNSAEISNEILNYLRVANQSVKLRRVEFVGSQVGDELKEGGGLAMLWASLGVLIYVALRFQMRFSVGAVVATIHDVIITIGVFSVFQLEFDLTIVAAVLTVLGYSLNDTIVVFDRIRENFHKMRNSTPVDVMNTSLNQTLSRTLMTGLTTLLVLIALFFFGGETIHGFSMAIIIGILFGTYSSIYIASPVTLWLGITKQDLMPVEKEGMKSDSRL